MADVKFQAVRGKTPAYHVDFRGDSFLGSPDDEHRTFLEIKDADTKLVETVLQFGPEVNALFDKLTDVQPDALGQIAGALGLKGEGDVRLQVRVYDE